MQFVTMEEACTNLKHNKLWLSSHGGVSSEYMTKVLGIVYPTVRLASSRLRFDTVIVHFNKPILSGPKKAIFMFGDLYNSIVSQIKRHQINAGKMGNNRTYPLIPDLSTFIKICHLRKDPYNIKNMFYNFTTLPTGCPLFLMKYNPPPEVIEELKRFADKDFEYNFIPRKTDFLKDQRPRIIRVMEAAYKDLYWIMNNMPTVVIRYPTSSYQLSSSDFKIKDEPVEQADKELLSQNLNLTLLNVIEFDNTKYTFYKNTENNNNLYIKNSRLTSTPIKLNICANAVSPFKFNMALNLLINMTDDKFIIIRFTNLNIGSYVCTHKNVNLPQFKNNYKLSNMSPLQMWNYPHYVGFFKTDKTLSSIIFNAENMNYNIKDLSPSPSPSPSITILYNLEIVNANVKLHYLDNKSKLKSLCFDFVAFCKHFSMPSISTAHHASDASDMTIETKELSQPRTQPSFKPKSFKVLKIEPKLPPVRVSHTVGRIKHYSENDDVAVFDARSVVLKGDPIRMRETGVIRGGGYPMVYMKKPNDPQVCNTHSVPFKQHFVKEGRELLSVNDSRLFKYQNRSYLISNYFTYFKAINFGRKKSAMMLYDISARKFIKLSILRYPKLTMAEYTYQKNWTPYVYNDKLYFIYSIKPTCVLEVINIDRGICNVVKGNPLTFNDNINCFGSTPLLQWTDSKFIGFAHRRTPWLSIPCVYDAKKMQFDKIYDPYTFPLAKHRLAQPWRNKEVQFPYELKIHDKNTVILGLELQDRCPTWYYIDYSSFVDYFGIGERTYTEVSPSTAVESSEESLTTS